MTCVMCGEWIGPSDETVRVATVEDHAAQAHRECMLRNVMGGIGHLTDHVLWCVSRGDPDGGHTYRESALLVDEWVREHGTEEREG
jgi:hypothetical protein